jgi:hypothetical protein
MSNFEEPIMFKDSSLICDTIYKDSDIFMNVGYKNYIMLCRKFPKHFTFFEECNTENENIGYIPGYINLYLTGDAYNIKSDIIKTMHYDTWISPNSELVFGSKPLEFKPTEFRESLSIWIIICIVIITLFFIATYVLLTCPLYKNWDILT